MRGVVRGVVVRVVTGAGIGVKTEAEIRGSDKGSDRGSNRGYDRGSDRGSGRSAKQSKTKQRRKKNASTRPPQATSARPSAEKGAQGRNWEGVWQEQGGRRAQKDTVTQPPRTPQKPSPRAWHLHSPAWRRVTKAKARRP